MATIHWISANNPDMTPAEYEGLCADISSQGLLVPILTWRGGIVDGRHRERACTDVGVSPDYAELPDAWEERRVLAYCRGLEERRSTTPGQKAMVAVLDGEELKKRGPARKHGGPRERGRSADATAERAGVSSSTVEKARMVAARAPQAAALVRAGGMSLEQAVRIAQAPEENRAAMTASLATETRSAETGDSWGTPREWIELARQVMGGIDTDPASNEGAQKIVQAATYYTAEDNGLAQTWTGRVWMNPPYSQPLVTLFAERLIEMLGEGHASEAMVLVNNATDTRFAQMLLEYCSAALFPAGRISFCLPGTDTEVQGTRQGQMLVYFGDNVKRFVSACAGLGWVGVSP